MHWTEVKNPILFWLTNDKITWLCFCSVCVQEYFGIHCNNHLIKPYAIMLGKFSRCPLVEKCTSYSSYKKLLMTKECVYLQENISTFEIRKRTI